MSRFCHSVCCVIALAAILSSGCTSGVRHSVSPDDTVIVHKVRAGETLEDIAEEYYGDRDRDKLLADFNDLGRANSVAPGAVLRVPMNGEDLERRGNRLKARAPYNQGLDQIERGAYLDAVQYFQRALKLDPDFVEAHYNLGVTLQKLKSYDKAIARFRIAVDMAQNEPRYHHALGNSYFHVERFEEAALSFEVVIRYQPEHKKALYSLAMSYERQGRAREAKDTWQRYLELDDSSVWATEARKRLKKLE